MFKTDATQVNRFAHAPCSAAELFESGGDLATRSVFKRINSDNVGTRLFSDIRRKYDLRAEKVVGWYYIGEQGIGSRFFYFLPSKIYGWIIILFMFFRKEKI